MTGITIGGSILEDKVDVATYTSDIYMLPFEFEDEKVVVKIGR